MTDDEELVALVNRRDALELRHSSGERLSLAERRRLRALNREIERRLPQAPPLPADVIAAVEEVERG